MKKFLNLSYIVLLGLLTIAFNGCTNEYSYDPTGAEGLSVYFPTTQSSSIEIKDDEENFVVLLERQIADQEMTVNLILDDPSGKFSIPSSVTFAAGEKSTNVVVVYDATKFEYDVPVQAVISITDENIMTPYGASQFRFSATRPSPLEYIGEGKYTDDFWYENVENPVEVSIYRNTVSTNVYRIYLDYAAVAEAVETEANGNQSAYVDVTILQPGDVLKGVTITKNGIVYYTPIDLGYTYAETGTDVVAYHPADFSVVVPSFAKEDIYATSYVSEYQEDGTPGVIKLSGLILFDFENGRGWAPYQGGSSIATIIFPGFTPSDYSSDVTYNGIFTDASNNVFAVGNLTLGADASNVKAVVMPADADPNAVADAIAAGELEAIDVVAGAIQVPIPEDMTGKLQIIVVVMNDEGKVKSVATAPFEY